MSNTKTQPLYRAKFCAVTGTDEKGKDQLGHAVEIGAVWPRKDAGKGAILKLHIVPQNLDRGVILLHPFKGGDEQ